jgi:hypothetical protein
MGGVLDPLALLAKFHTLWITEGLRLRFAGLSLSLLVFVIEVARLQLEARQVNYHM